LRLPINNSNLRPILHRFRDMADYWSIFRPRTRVTFVGVNPQTQDWKFNLKKIETFFYRTV